MSGRCRKLVRVSRAVEVTEREAVERGRPWESKKSAVVLAQQARRVVDIHGDPRTCNATQVDSSREERGGEEDVGAFGSSRDAFPISSRGRPFLFSLDDRYENEGPWRTLVYVAAPAKPLNLLLDNRTRRGEKTKSLQQGNECERSLCAAEGRAMRREEDRVGRRNEENEGSD